MFRRKALFRTLLLLQAGGFRGSSTPDGFQLYHPIKGHEHPQPDFAGTASPPEAGAKVAALHTAEN